MGHIFSKLFFDLFYDFWNLLFWLPIVSLIISAIIRKNSRKISNIICIISICIICTISIGFSIKTKMHINYNNKICPFSFGDNLNYDSIIELVNNVIENNEKKENKITIEYKKMNYTTPLELNNLINVLNKIDTYTILLETGKYYPISNIGTIYIYEQ